jgi:hypothetical protein
MKFSIGFLRHSCSVSGNHERLLYLNVRQVCWSGESAPPLVTLEILNSHLAVEIFNWIFTTFWLCVWQLQL